ncbi:hypothetical protein KPH14_012275 [Odynerus spinipes]|uniref:Reverse transcriptase Ty1/copia-type domain-containing protein n=1 Tax=Odynerus spinipes TaxID=1348599 RepID=A0AAD9VLD4_9HYME|nr:hypothetical protein KPH14_012275 [Odynerus spinipes]
MAVGVRSITKNDTWTVVPRPKDRDVIGSRIVLRNKYRPDGSIEKRKVRLVAQGFSQRLGIHFNQTYAPVAILNSIRLLIAIAARYGMFIEQLDVTTAYLNGVLEEEVFMSPPKMLNDALETIIESEGKNSQVKVKTERMLNELSCGDRVCLLKKSLYGLRQAGKCWFNRLDRTLKKHGMIPCHADPCVYYAGQGEDSLLVAVYVDDILIISRNKDAISAMKKNLSR